MKYSDAAKRSERDTERVFSSDRFNYRLLLKNILLNIQVGLGLTRDLWRVGGVVAMVGLGLSDSQFHGSLGEQWAL